MELPQNLQYCGNAGGYRSCHFPCFLHFCYLKTFINFDAPIISIYTIITTTGRTFRKAALLWKCKALHSSPFFVIFYIFSLVFQNFVQRMMFIYANITITGKTFAKSPFLWKCHGLYVLPFSVFLNFCLIFYFFQNFVRPDISIYVIITTAGGTFPKSALLWKCRNNTVSHFP